METRRLEYFLRIVDAGSISGAARDVGLSQPALSQQLAILEAEMKAPLVHRSRHGATPTAAGQQLYRRARILLRQLDDIREIVRESRETIAGNVAVGFPTSVATAVSLPFVRAMVSQYPQIRLRMVEGYSGMLTERMRAGHLDMALLFHEAPVPGLRSEPLWREELLLVGHGQWRAPAQVTLSDLTGFPLMLPTADNSARQAFDASLARSGLAVTPVCEIDSIVTLKNAVVQGIGYTILPWTAVAAEVGAGRMSVSRVRDGATFRVVSLSTLEAAHPTPALQRTGDLIRALADAASRSAGNIGVTSLREARRRG